MTEEFEKIYALIKQGEGLKLDFKKRIDSASKIAKTIVSFANSEGGKIVIGVDDEGEITGVDPAQEKFMMIKAGNRFCDPKIFIHFKLLRIKQSAVLIAEIEKSKISDNRALDENGNWLPYVRVGDQSILAPGIDKQLLDDKHNRNPIPILLEENKGLINYLEESESITVKEYMQMMNISYNTARRSLKNLVEHSVLDEEWINHTPFYFLKNEKEILS